MRQIRFCTLEKNFKSLVTLSKLPFLLSSLMSWEIQV